MTFHLKFSCYVPLSSILGPLLLLLYVNDLNKASDVLGPIMFVDDTNLLLFPSEHKNPFSNGKL